jgi:hypothetical protein
MHDLASIPAIVSSPDDSLASHAYSGDPKPILPPEGTSPGPGFAGAPAVASNFPSPVDSATAATMEFVAPSSSVGANVTKYLIPAVVAIAVWFFTRGIVWAIVAGIVAFLVMGWLAKKNTAPAAAA